MSTAKPVRSMLISQPAPTEPNSPYQPLADKYGINLVFRKFIQIEGISLNDFRKQGLNPADFTAFILSSKIAVDHFFRLTTEMRIEFPPEVKYFCVGEATSKYLQKYIQLRKRKLFVGEKTAMDLMPLVLKHKTEKYLFPGGAATRSDLVQAMKDKGMDVAEATIYKTVDSDLSDLKIEDYDLLCFFSPAGVQALGTNFPHFKQGETRIAVFGSTTAEEARNQGLRIDIEAPKPNLPSMTSALEDYLKQIGQKRIS
jgi:uroporphyrinogen-III synthase